jgi:EpsI family protein
MKKTGIYYFIACLILILASISVKAYRHTERVPLPLNPDTIPREFGEFIGKDGYPTDSNYHDPSADQWILRVYSGNGSDNPIHVFFGYWESQNEQKRITPPRYTSLGCKYFCKKTTRLGYGKNTVANVKEFLNEKGQEKELVQYCYIIDGIVFSNEYQLRFLNTVNALLHRKNNVALLRVSVPVTSEFPVESAEIYIEDFLKDFLPIVKGYLPK